MRSMEICTPLAAPAGPAPPAGRPVKPANGGITTAEFLERYRRGGYDSRYIPEKPADFTGEYLQAPRYIAESRRLKTVWYYRMLEHGASQALRAITELAMSIFDIQTVVVTFLDQECSVHFAVNLPGSPHFDRDDAMCSHTILSPTRSVFLVPDTSLDWRFAKNPICAGGVRFYAASPLLSKGVSAADRGETYALGSLCLVDSVPHHDFDTAKQEQLNLLSEMVVQEFDRQLTVLRLADRDRMSAALVRFSEDKEGGDQLLRAQAYVKDALQVEHVVLTEPAPGQKHIQIDGENVPLGVLLWDSPDNCKMSISVPVHANVADERPAMYLTAYTDAPHHVLDQQDAEFMQQFARFLTSHLQSKLIEMANRAKSTFMQSVSHELRTPLHGILTTCELLEEMDLKITEKGMVQVIQSSGRNLLNVLNGLLDFHQFETKQVRQQRALRNLLELQQEVADAVALSLLGDTKILLCAEIPEDMQNLVFDGNLARQVLLSVLSNAVKFTQTGTIVFHLRATAAAANRAVDICAFISDTGVGISDEFSAKGLFLPFQKEDSFTQGIGLGLAIARSIARAMGGDVALVKTQKGQGSVFEVGFSGNIPETAPAAATYANSHDWQMQMEVSDKDEAQALRAMFAGLRVNEARLTSAVAAKRKRENPKLIKVMEFGGRAVASENVDLSAVGYGLLVVSPEAVPLAGDMIRDRRNIVVCPRPVGPMRLRGCIEQLDRLKAAAQSDELVKRGKQENGVAVVSKAPLRTLIVDDNSVNRNMLAMFCKRRNMTYTLAVDGNDAYQSYVQAVSAGQTFETVLMDIQMPVMDGPSSVKMIRSFEKEKDLKPCFIVMLTGITDEEVKEECFRIGANDYYTKPVSLKAIDAIIAATSTTGENGTATLKPDRMATGFAM